MANTYKLISSYTVGSGGAATISFTSIPSTYTDLLVNISARNTSNNYGSFYVRVNGEGSTTVTGKWLYTDGYQAVYSNTANSFLWNVSNQTANTFSNTQLYIPNYTGSADKVFGFETTTENSVISEAYQQFAGITWANSATITQLDFGTFGGSDKFAQYSTAYLYGIKSS